jgi:hypothetical protein
MQRGFIKQLDNFRDVLPIIISKTNFIVANVKPATIHVKRLNLKNSSVHIVRMIVYKKERLSTNAILR